VIRCSTITLWHIRCRERASSTTSFATVSSQQQDPAKSAMAPKAEARNRYIPGRCSAFRQPIFLVLPPGVLGRDSPFKIGPPGIESLGSFIVLPLRRIKRRLGFRGLLLALGALLFRILNLAADKDSRSPRSSCGTIACIGADATRTDRN
jgi:hypothetical protein